MEDLLLNQDLEPVSVCSLMENYAIRRLQEQFITQVAAQVLFEEGVKYMEQEMDEIGEMRNQDPIKFNFCLQTNKKELRTHRGNCGSEDL